MSGSLFIRDCDSRAVEVLSGNRLLLRYVYAPDTPENESPKPYCHPVNTLAGRTLTNFRPNDHPWHHALAFTLASVDGHNFWGGPTWTPDSGYTWLPNHGSQLHVRWLSQETTGSHAILREGLLWQSAAGETLLQEERTLRVVNLNGLADAPAWTLDWQAHLSNATTRTLTLSHYHAAGLAGSHYTGLLFRGSRDLLANSADPSTGIIGPDGENADALHGRHTPWLAFRCSHDGAPESRSTIMLINRQPSDAAWFLRPTLPAAAFCLHHPGSQMIDVGASINLHHRLIFADGDVDPRRIIAASDDVS